MTTHDPRAPRALADNGPYAGLPHIALPARYQLGAVLGRTMESVRMRAVDRDTGDPVVIKTAGKPSVIQKEADILAAIDHPGVVRLRHWDTVAGGAYLVTNDVTGASLEDVLANDAAQTAIEGVIQSIWDIAETLKFIHDLGFLHRGIRADVIWIDDGGRSILVSADRAAPIKLSLGFERPPVRHSVFCPPEQIDESDEEGPWSDVYSLSALAYWALSNEKPPSVVARRRDAALTAMPVISERVAPAVVAAIESGLRMDPEERPSSITLWQEIAAGQADPPPVHSEPPPASTDEDGNDGNVSRTQPTAADYLESDQLNDTVDTRPELIDLDETVEIDMRSAPIQRARTEPVEEQPALPADPDVDRDVNRIEPAVYPDITKSPLSGAMPSSRRGISIALIALSLLLFVSGALVVWFGFPIYERKFKTDWVVDAGGGGDTKTISEAVRRAGRGATIRVAPGTYPETVVLERALNLRAPSNGQRPVIAPPSGPCLVTSAGFGSVSGFVMRVTTDQPNEACVIVAKGRMQLNDNEISGGAGAAILVRDGAAPILRGNRVSDTDGPGLVVATGAAGFIERNSFIEIGSASILVRGGGAPRISENIVDNGGGVIFAEGAKGWLLNNRISNPRGTGVQVLSGAAPQIFDNAVERAAEAGIFIYDYGRGVVQNNTVRDSGLSGIVIASGAAPRITGNEIIGSGEHGILIVGTSGTTIRDNAIRNSRGHAIAIAADANAEIGNNVMSENREPQVLDDRNR